PETDTDGQYLALERALIFVLGRESVDLVIESFGRRPWLQLRSSGTVLWPHLMERADNGAPKKITGFLRLRAIVGHEAVEHDDIGCHLRQLVSLYVVRTLCRGDQQTEDKGSHRRDQPHPQLHEIF